MENITCLRCGTANEFYIEESGPHTKAICNHCNRYIKFIQKELPKLYVGKYKGIAISEIEDIGYLKWALATLHLTSAIKMAIQSRITTFEHLAK